MNAEKKKKRLESILDVMVKVGLRRCEDRIYKEMAKDGIEFLIKNDLDDKFIEWLSEKYGTETRENTV